MPNLAEKSFQPIHCRLSADARFSQVDFANDHTWELTTSLNDPPAITLHTTYGLRAHWMHVFPSFTASGTTLSDPLSFASPPRLATSTPSYARVTFAPFPHFDVTMEFYVPSSNAICGRISIVNTATGLQNWKVAFNAVLNPLTRGQRMTPGVYGLNTVLQGSTQNIAPVFYITGGPEPSLSPYASLSIPLTLQPGRTRTFTWALASLRTLDESFTHARQMTARPWDANLLRVEMSDRRDFYRVNTSQPEWDAVFNHSQRQALQLLVCGPVRLPGQTFVLSRSPDNGFSADGSGNDYGPLWIGQTALNAWSFCKLILPGYPRLARELLDSFLASQRADGFISNSLGISDHSSPDNAFPILAQIARLIQDFDDDPDWLRRSYAPLIRYLHYWFSTPSSQEGEEIPTWSSTIQAGVDDLPEYSTTRSDGPAGILLHLISPSLLALLFNECSRMLEFARELGIEEDLEWLSGKLQALNLALQACWNPQSHSYRMLDAQTGIMLHPQKLATFRKNGKAQITRKLNPPGRLAMEIRPGVPMPPKLSITLHGKVNEIPVSRKVLGKDFTWYPDRGTVFCSTLFDSIDEISVQGLDQDSILLVTQPGSSQEDISLLLPLWAGVPDQKTAQALVSKTILPRYLTPIGLSSSPRSRNSTRLPADAQVSLFWNLMMAEGLARYGFAEASAALMKSLLIHSSDQLAATGMVAPATRVDSAAAVGEPDSLNSLLSAIDFLPQLGVEQWSESRMIIKRMNTFFRPITVEYRRTTCEFLSTETVIQPANGERMAVNAPPAKRILFPSGKEKNGQEQ